MRSILYKIGVKLISMSYSEGCSSEKLVIHSLNREIEELTKQRNSLQIKITLLKLQAKEMV